MQCRSHQPQMSDAIYHKKTLPWHKVTNNMPWIRKLSFRTAGSKLCSQSKKEGCVAKLLSAAITHTRPFNLHLDFWKSRSWEIKVCFKPRKIASPGNLDFFLGLHLEKKLGLYYKSERNPVDKLKKKIQLEIFLRFETCHNLSRPRFSEIKVQIKRPLV